MTLTTSSRIAPNASQLATTRAAIDAHIASIANHPNRRDGAYPYYLFHEPGETIQGTVLLFHGFSNRPHQMWRLADYLFQNGFNVYQANLAGHAFLPPDGFWPQIDLKPEYAIPLKQKVSEDPVLMNFLHNMAHQDTSQLKRPNPIQMAALVQRLLKIEPRLLDMKQALENYDDPDFERYYISSHTQYLEEARARLGELDAMPGPIYTIGLSVGGAVALAIAADRPDRIEKVVAYAPLLEVVGKDRELYINIAGTLDLKEMGWDPNVQFPVGCFTAANRFGDFVLTNRSKKALKDIPTFLVLTENEDAADVKTNIDLSRELGGRNQHFSYLYPAADLVPHPMVDPTEVSQGMSNRFWQSMYQETYRFLTQTRIDPNNMSNLEQDLDLPQVPNVQ
jgi:pimeloyl-ACP methyl ester carboxylesterase